jgi:hypothetical protein
MSEKRSSSQWRTSWFWIPVTLVASELWSRFAKLPGSTPILVGLFLLGFPYAVLNERWCPAIVMEWQSRRRLNRILIRVCFIPVLAFLGGLLTWYMLKPPSADPERLDNKYIRVSKIASPIGNKVFVLLFEFGVKTTPSNGLSVIVRANKQSINTGSWQGVPHLKDPQDEMPRDLYNQIFNNDEGYAGGYSNSFQIRPDRSVYVYLESKDEVTSCTIRYLATATNRALNPSDLDKIGALRRVESKPANLLIQ